MALKSEGTQDRALWLLSSLLTSCVISGKKLNLLLSAGITGLRHPTRFIPVLGIKPRALCLLGTHPANGVATPAKPPPLHNVGVMFTASCMGRTHSNRRGQI